MVARLQYLRFCLFEMHVDVFFVIIKTSVQGSGSLTLVRQQRFIRFIYNNNNCYDDDDDDDDHDDDDDDGDDDVSQTSENTKPHVVIRLLTRVTVSVYVSVSPYRPRVCN